MILKVNADRLKADFDALARIGEIHDAEGRAGVHRPALGEAHLMARRWFLEQARAAGLETAVDTAGNHSAILPSRAAGAPTLLLGSHSDSVPNGGRFDGALGLLAALEALRRVKEAGLQLAANLEAIDFTDEEGTLVGLFGSSAVAGTLTAEALRQPRGGRAALEEGLARAGLTEAGLLSARREPSSLAGYLELHIEQGPRLAVAGVAIGVVTGIVGITSARLMLRGAANHAGTTPMETRQDAGLGASAFVVSARELVMRDFPGCVVNVGQMQFRPGGFNIIPGAAELALEFRAPEAATLSRLEGALLDLAAQIASQHGLSLDVAPLGACAPAPMSGRTQAAFAAAAEALGLTHTRLHSGAGHDAQSLAGITPSGMIFVPSPNGVSHSPAEFTAWEDCLNGANVLLGAALRLLEPAQQGAA